MEGLGGESQSGGQRFGCFRDVNLEQNQPKMEKRGYTTRRPFNKFGIHRCADRF